MTKIEVRRMPRDNTLRLADVQCCSIVLAVAGGAASPIGATDLVARAGDRACIIHGSEIRSVTWAYLCQLAGNISVLPVKRLIVEVED